MKAWGSGEGGGFAHLSVSSLLAQRLVSTAQGQAMPRAAGDVQHMLSPWPNEAPL